MQIDGPPDVGGGTRSHNYMARSRQIPRLPRSTLPSTLLNQRLPRSSLPSTLLKPRPPGRILPTLSKLARQWTMLRKLHNLLRFSLISSWEDIHPKWKSYIHQLKSDSTIQSGCDILHHVSKDTIHYLAWDGVTAHRVDPLLVWLSIIELWESRWLIPYISTYTKLHLIPYFEWWKYPRSINQMNIIIQGDAQCLLSFHCVLPCSIQGRVYLLSWTGRWHQLAWPSFEQSEPQLDEKWANFPRGGPRLSRWIDPNSILTNMTGWFQGNI